MSDKHKTKAPLKSKPRKLNRAQQRAMAVRAAETRAEVNQVIESGLVEEAAPPSSARAKARQRKAQNPVKHISQLSRQAEYRYIRSDVRRLLITAGSMFLLMMAVLVVI